METLSFSKCPSFCACNLKTPRLHIQYEDRKLCNKLSVEKDGTGPVMVSETLYPEYFYPSVGGRGLPQGWRGSWGLDGVRP